MGNTGRTAAGDVQVMSAGTGVTHAEYNLEDEATSLFQIWIIPDSAGGDPDWGMKQFPRGDRAGAWELLASGELGGGKQAGGDDKGDGALVIRSDARVLAASLAAGESATYAAAAWRYQYLVSTGGRIRVNGQEAQPRDGVAITGEESIVVEAIEDCELVLVDAR